MIYPTNAEPHIPGNTATSKPGLQNPDSPQAAGPAPPSERHVRRHRIPLHVLTGRNM